MRPSTEIRTHDWVTSPDFMKRTAFCSSNVCDIRHQSLHHKTQLADLLHERGSKLFTDQVCSQHTWYACPGRTSHWTIQIAHFHKPVAKTVWKVKVLHHTCMYVYVCVLDRLCGEMQSNILVLDIQSLTSWRCL